MPSKCSDSLTRGKTQKTEPPAASSSTILSSMATRCLLLSFTELPAVTFLIAVLHRARARQWHRLP